MPWSGKYWKILKLTGNLIEYKQPISYISEKESDDVVVVY